MNLAHSMPN